MSQGHSASKGPTSKGPASQASASQGHSAGSADRQGGRSASGWQAVPSPASPGLGNVRYGQPSPSSFSARQGSHSYGQSDAGSLWASECENVGSTERVVSAGLGGLLVASGIVRGRLPGLVLTAVGASLLYRGLSGFCAMYQQLGISTCQLPQPGLGHQPSGSRLAAGPLAGFMPEHEPIKGVKIEESFTVKRAAHELYDIWTHWDQLPKYLPHIEKVETLGGNRTRWSARAPMGVLLSWEAEIIKQEADRMVSWKSTSGDVATAGSIHFQARGDKQTEVKVSMQYDPPGGKTVAAVAEFFHMGLDQRIREDLQHFKKQVEAT